MGERRQVSDEELSDLIDGRLDAARKAEIEHEMARDTALARRYTILLEQDRLLTRLGAEILDEPVPDRLLAILSDADEEEDDQAGGQGTTGPGRTGVVRGPQILVLIAGIAAGMAGGWFGHATLATQSGGLFQTTLEQAAISHRLFRGRRRRRDRGPR